MIEVEREQALRDAMSSLSPRCQRLIQMLFFESPSRPYQEIARTLNLAGGSIGFIRGRCLDRLRAKLQSHGFR
jgi:DNA-directed RNA polymerase specialized sigma24 family protein